MEVWQSIVQDFGAVLKKYGKAVALVVKRHPRELNGPADDFESKSQPHLPVFVLPPYEPTPREAVLGADLVIGMNSILLLEACLLGKRTISYQPNLKIVDPLPSNARGWSRSIYKIEDLMPALESELFDPETRRKRESALRSIPPLEKFRHRASLNS